MKTKTRIGTMTLILTFTLALAGMARAQTEKTWTAAVDNNWNVEGNWDPEGVPDSDHIAVFDGDVSDASCVIDVNAVAAGILITNYTGTITQGAGNTVTVGASGFVQHSGTFQGGDSDMGGSCRTPRVARLRRSPRGVL